MDAIVTLSIGERILKGAVKLPESVTKAADDAAIEWIFNNIEMKEDGKKQKP